MERFKTTYPQLWKPDYEEIMSILEDASNIAEVNIHEANKLYRTLPISKYDTFQAYVYNNDINALNVIKGSNERTKILRAKRKNKICPMCGCTLTFNDMGGVCNNCGYVAPSKSTAPNARQASNNNKHIFKQLDALTGTHKAPQNVTKIIDYIVEWLTNLRYIYNWLIANDGKRYTLWVKKYEQVTGEKIGPEFFNRTIERKPENMWNYNIFKMFTDELYAMLEYATRLSNEAPSNMLALDDDTIVRIFTTYVEQFHKLPNRDEKFTFEGVEYEFGTYISELSLLYQTPENHIKSKLENLIKTNDPNFTLTLPGLMFNFREVYNKSENSPKKYCYQQEFCWITNRTFHTEFIDISKQDKEAIADLIIKFNEYYKEQAFSTADKSCNSPLYCCTIVCVLNLPYFRKYARALNFVPIKDRGTANHIRKQFFDFSNAKADLLKPYMTTGDESKTAHIINDMIIQSKVMAVDDGYGDGDDGEQQTSASESAFMTTDNDESAFMTTDNEDQSSTFDIDDEILF